MVTWRKNLLKCVGMELSYTFLTISLGGEATMSTACRPIINQRRHIVSHLIIRRRWPLVSTPYKAVYAFSYAFCCCSILQEWKRPLFASRVNRTVFALDRFQAASSESEINIYEIEPAGDAASACIWGLKRLTMQVYIERTPASAPSRQHVRLPRRTGCWVPISMSGRLGNQQNSIKSNAAQQMAKRE